jgi:hypothetical protein
MIAVFLFSRLAFTGSKFQNRAIRTPSPDLDFSLAKYVLTLGVVPRWCGTPSPVHTFSFLFQK